MPNPKGNIATLKPADSPWRNKPTKTIRIPVVFADELLEKAHQLDRGDEISLEMIDKIQSDIQKAMKLVNSMTFLNNKLYVNDNKKKVEQFNKVMQTVCHSIEELKASKNSDKI